MVASSNRWQIYQQVDLSKHFKEMGRRGFWRKKIVIWKYK